MLHEINPHPIKSTSSQLVSLKPSQDLPVVVREWKSAYHLELYV